MLLRFRLVLLLMGRPGGRPTSFLNLTLLLIALPVIEVFPLTIMCFRDMSSLVSRGGEQKLADLRHGGHNAERIGEASHPGPANIINQISVYCCNVQSATGAWALLEHGSCKTDELRIWCLQETRMKDYEAQAFHRAAQRRGYKVYQLAGNTTLDR